LPSFAATGLRRVASRHWEHLSLSPLWFFSLTLSPAAPEQHHSRFTQRRHQKRAEGLDSLLFEDFAFVGELALDEMRYAPKASCSSPSRPARTAKSALGSPELYEKAQTRSSEQFASRQSRPHFIFSRAKLHSRRPPSYSAPTHSWV
jgi:hypothetical protein